MAKVQDSRAKTSAAPARPHIPTSERRIPAEVERVEAPQRAAAAMRLVAEVERLELELAAARARMAELEARAEIDPLTDVLNRRGFARELKRALDRKSTRLNSSHVESSYAVSCAKKKR